MRVIQKIYFIGGEYLDFVFYTAQVLNNLHKKVAVKDTSEGLDLVRLVPGMSDEEEWTYKGIDYYCTECLEGYDFQLIYTDNIDGIVGEAVIFNTFLCKSSVDMVRILLQNNNQVYVVIRDVPLSKYGKSMFKKRFCYNELESDVKVYDVFMDVIDYAYRIDMDFDGYCDFRKLSFEYGKVLCKVLEDLLDLNSKNLIQAFKHAREGRIIEDSSME